jgi:hypothetical protein
MDLPQRRRAGFTVKGADPKTPHGEPPLWPTSTPQPRRADAVAKSASPRRG